MSTASIIIPVYNNEDILSEIESKLFSLANQYYEIIIIDDCSTDNTYDRVLSFIEENNLKNVDLIKNKKNMGPSYSRNLGIKKSMGDYIAFLDSDDDWHPKKLDIQIMMMKKTDAKICATMHKTIVKEALAEEQSVQYEVNNVPYINVSWPKILFVSPFATPSVVLHKSLKKYLFDESMKYAEDYNLWKRVTYDYPAIKIMLPLTYTFKHDFIDSSNSLSTNLKKMQEGVRKSFILLFSLNNIKSYEKFLLFIALCFSEVKYIRRLIKSICYSFLKRLK